MYFKDNTRLDELMEFLAGYVRVVHANRYYKSLLIKNPGSSYLDIITASDVAYIVSLISNSDKVWLEMTTSDGDPVKPLYTSRKGIKRVYGVTTWNRSGMKYYRDVVKTWTEAFTRNTPAFKVLRRHWDKWIEDKDGGRKFMLNDGDVKKSAYSLLKKRSEEDVCAADDEDDEDDKDDHEEFEYDSDPEENTIILSNWDHKRGGRGVRNSYENSDDDEIGGNGDARGGDNEYGHIPNGDEESEVGNDSINGRAEDDVEDSSDDEEETAVPVVEVGRKNNKRKQGQRSQPTNEDRTTSGRRIQGSGGRRAIK